MRIMNDPMNELLKLALAPTTPPQKSLSSAERERLHRLNTSILSEVKEREEMGKYGTYCKRSAQTAAITTALLLAFGSVSAIAAFRFLNPAQVATESNNPKLAEAFQGSDALMLNESQTFDGYEVTLLGSASGKSISSSIPADTIEDEIYAVLALRRTDGKPMPEFDTPENAKLQFFPSFYIHGLDPARFNLDGMSGSYAACQKNGIRYYTIAMSNIEMFADQGIYVGLCTAGEDGDYNPNAYQLDPKSGDVTRKENFAGVNALFDLPIDPNKADPEKAQKFLDSFNHPVSAQPNLTKKEKEMEKKNQELLRLADAFLAGITPQNINQLCTITDKQICVPDENGVFTYAFPIGETKTGHSTEKVKDRLTDKTPGVLNISSGFGMGGDKDGYHMKYMRFTAYRMNKDGTITRYEYKPKASVAKKIEAKCSANLKKAASKK